MFAITIERESFHRFNQLDGIGEYYCESSCSPGCNEIENPGSML
jgi:hypothetical protein